MKRIRGVLFSIGALWVIGIAACSDSATTKAKVDSTVVRIDSTANAVWDSTKEKVKNIKKGLDSTFDKKKDSNHK